MTNNTLVDEIIVIVALADYHKNPQRPQHIAVRLARNNNVIYVEAPFSIVGLIRNGTREIGKIVRNLQGLRLEQASLALWTPPPSLYPFDKFAFVNRLYYRLFSWQLRKAIAKLSWTKPAILYLIRPGSTELVDRLPNKLMVIDWYTPWVEHWAHIILKSKIWKPFVTLNYLLKTVIAKNALTKANIVFVGAQVYGKQAAEWGFKTIFIPNGVDVQNWILLEGEQELSPDIAAIPKPRIGVIAARIHRDIVDFELIVRVAQGRPKWSWVFIGLPVGDIEEIRALPNVHFLGHKPYDSLPFYLAGFDICAIPYRLNTTTQSGIPTKLLECLPSGKPIITYPSMEIKSDPDISSIVYFASTSEEFIHWAEVALAGECESLVRERKALSARFDWNAIVRSIGGEISNHLNYKRSNSCPVLNPKKTTRER